MLKKAPQLTRPYLQLLWETFWELRSEASSGFGAVMVPRSAIRQFGIEELHLLPDELDAFVWITRRLDTYYVNKQNSKSPK